MPISDKYKLIFVHIPKNAGTAITNTLEMVDIGHHGWSYYKNKYPNKWKNYKKISVIRNPWDRVVSCYEYAKMDKSYWHAKEGKARAGKHLDYDLLKDKSFEQCLDILKHTPQRLKHQGWRNQSDYIYHNDQLMVDHTLDKYEINDKLTDILGFEINIPKINVSNNKDYRDYYVNNDLIDIVSKNYKIDLINFNYEESFNILS